MMFVAFPYHLDASGATATDGLEQHVRELVEELLLTAPGERVNRPDLGCGLLGLTFEPAAPELATALEVAITSAVHKWLGDLISIESIAVSAEEGRIAVQLDYEILATSVVASAVVVAPEVSGP
jgi:phage baseplate assembly protein W